MPIIRSILDNDLYKFTMQNAVLKYRQRIPVSYVFNNRRPEGRFNDQFAHEFESELASMSDLTMTDDQHQWLGQTLPWLGEAYLQYLKNYRFDPAEVDWQVRNGELELRIHGTWERTILWEVPLMATISELFFRHCDRSWDQDLQVQRSRTYEKGNRLSQVSFTDFGTRRRRSFAVQELVVETLMQFASFVGTSNVHLAHKFQIRPIGTMAHEWIMGISALESLRHANRYAMRIWQDVYQGKLGTALTDTFHTSVFLDDFDDVLARLFDGVRHDSGDPIEFAEKVIAKYLSLGIRPITKSIIFSDGLDVDQTLKISEALAGKIQYSFGIGTHLTNDFPGSRALNMVIKLSTCNGVPVVKLSDTPSKAIGDSDAIKVALWTFFNRPLDAENEN